MKHHFVNVLGCVTILINHWTCAEGVIQFYLDPDCKKVDGSSVKLDAEECFLGNQKTAVAALSMPDCGKRYYPLLTISDKDNCNQSPSISPPTTNGDVGACLSFSSGSGIGAVGFACGDEVVTILFPSITQSETSSSTQSTVSAVLATSTKESSTSSSSRPTPTPDLAIPNGQEDDSAGLSRSDKITMGCSIGIGIPALVFAILTWYNHWWERREQETHPRLRIVRRDVERNADDPPPYALVEF